MNESVNNISFYFLSLKHSYAYATLRTVASSNIFPVICIPTGSPFRSPVLMLNAGWPEALNGAVFSALLVV